MTIHVVQQGETLSSIAGLYQVSEERLVIENGITNPNNLVIGQTIAIIQPSVSYTIREGDTLMGIAKRYQVSVMQLLRNNPYLSDREYIFPGETIVISYETNQKQTIAVSGYAYPFIRRDVLRKTLPFLTYLTVFNYRITETGDLEDINDQEIIDIAKSYGVAPIMLVSTQSQLGVGNLETAKLLLNNPELQERSIDNMIEVLKRKGYYGLNQYFQFYSIDAQDLYVEYIERLSNKVRSEGYHLSVTVTLRQINTDKGIAYEKIDYSRLLPYVDGLSFLTYNWGLNYGPPVCATPVNLLREAMEHIITTIPPERIRLGLPVIGYNYPLPYIPGYTFANAITSEAAIDIAVEQGVSIEYNVIAEAAYFYYFVDEQSMHNVWFKDGRSIDALLGFVPEFGISGGSIWNIMYFFEQLWSILNYKYEIQKIQDLNDPLDK